FPTTRESISVDYGPATPKGLEDVSVDPLFVGRFQLPQPASGDPETSAGIDAGDPATAAALADELRRRSTATNQLLDAGRIDLGFHFPSILQPQPTATGAPGTPTVGPTVVPAAEIYVRVGGNDTNSGRSPDQALRTIQAAVEAARAGTEVIVGPGVYAETVEMTRSGTAEEPILLRADVSGSRTGDSAGPVVVDGSVARRGFFVDGASFVIIDGFTVINTVDAAIQVRRGAESVVIRNTEIYAGREDGIRVQDSPLVTLLNNLIYCNGRRGIVIAGSTGSANARVINNTVVGNRDRGVFIGTSTAPSAGAVLRNNLLQDNCSNNLQVATNSLEGYSGQYNLVSSPSYVGAMVHPTDTAYFEGGVVNRPAGFVSRAICNGVCRAPVPVPPSPTPRPTVPPLPNPPEFTIERGPGDFRLRQTLAGDPPPDGTGVDQGDPSLDRAYTDILRGRTTATNGVPDGGRIDIGYHFPR
ncbi:MAG TPA: right-handed parallel beta-helix repeat-containing protein, partial [Terriglobales bacterium]|nr:right-handed parallel beta-helix repeat-containing protein [Terriglobales bacterium]